MKDILIIFLLIALFAIPILIITWDIIQDFINDVFN